MRTLRVLLDTNLYVSYLLHPARQTVVGRVVREGIGGSFHLLVPALLLRELSRRVAEKPYLANRIEPEDLRELVAILEDTAEMLPEVGGPIPPVVRDPKDDYLVAHAVLGRAKYLVTGDDDLLVLERVEETSIVSPVRFVDILEHHPIPR